jgi:hypothetical protein
MQYIHFMTESISFDYVTTGYKNKLISSACGTKFLGFVTENSLSGKAQTEQLIPKLYTSCYPIRATKPFMSSRYSQVGTLFLFSFPY